MPVARISASRPIVYGGSAIQPVGSGAYFYADPARTITVPDESSLEFFHVVDGRYLADDWVLRGAIPAGSGDTNGPVLNGDAVVYYPAPGPTRHHVLAGVAYGYDAAPGSGASLSVESPSGVVLYGPLPIVSAGPDHEDWATPWKAPANTECLIRLSVGGPGVRGTVGARGHRIE
jgi:hypothetical protein